MTRTGRPKKAIRERRSKLVPVRMTTDEFAELTRLSEETGRSISSLMRDGARALGRLLKGKGESRKENE